MTVRSALLGAGLTALLALGTSACTTFDDDPVPGYGVTTAPVPDELVIDPTTSSAELVVGQTLVVDFGEINSSVGDGWVLDQDVDGVLSEATTRSEYLGEDGSTGGRDTLAFELEALAEGESTLVFEYRFRGDVPDFGHGPTPVTVTVTVTDH